jgi:hypothetical protein
MKIKILIFLILTILSLGLFHTYNYFSSKNLYKGLHLSKTQEIVLKKNKKTFYSKMEAIHDDINRINDQFNDSIIQEPQNIAKHNELKSLLSINFAKMMTLRIENIKTLSEILNEEQFSKYKFNYEKCKLSLTNTN